MDRNPRNPTGELQCCRRDSLHFCNRDGCKGSMMKRHLSRDHLQHHGELSTALSDFTSHHAQQLQGTRPHLTVTAQSSDGSACTEMCYVTARSCCRINVNMTIVAIVIALASSVFELSSASHPTVPRVISSSAPSPCPLITSR
eukprot:3038149-Rhodomonas_salina.2